MALQKLFRRSDEERLLGHKYLFLLLQENAEVADVAVETCFYILLRSRENGEQRILEGDKLLKLQHILGNSWERCWGLTSQSSLPTSLSDTDVVLEVGPRLSFSSPWCSNCVSICHSVGLEEIERVESSLRFGIRFSSSPSEEAKMKIVSALHDPMTQQVYTQPLESFLEGRTALGWSAVDVIKRGKEALREANDSMGLAFDEWDLDYYEKLFREKIQRNPTTVELFDLAQSNSEHSRHWFFKGGYILEGEKLPESLLDMVIGTNSDEFTNDNNVIRFSDNSSGIRGWTIPVIYSANPSESSSYLTKPSLRHIIFTAETHNFPTGVEPFSGAATGTGGRIRDIQAAGRGGHVIAGTAGYCFGNLHIPGYDLEWEEFEDYPANFATPLLVAIEASNGASDYGNKFGEPLIQGFARSFGMNVVYGDNREMREWIKPIMFSGGVGSIDHKMVEKLSPTPGNLVVKIGGPVYRIGVGGGAASSIQIQGDNVPSRDLGAVQRGDAEMEQKLNRVVRGCLELDRNPILVIHDQGAGGNANVLKEIMEGYGGVIFTDAFAKGDPTLSTLEIWGAEYQESNAILVHRDSLETLRKVSARERCPVDVVGFITGDNKVRLKEGHFEEVVNETDQNLPVNLNLDSVLGKMPQKMFHWSYQEKRCPPLSIPSFETPMSALKRVLRLPAVASKRYLTNKVDRSVTGLIAQQQCVGPFQTPVADVAVVALSYFSQEGAAISIGEQPIKLLVDSEAGARMTVFEAISNLASCRITSLNDVKCSANWMWPAKLPGEGYALYRACKAMCEVMKQLGVAVDGGKDSLSMAARVPGRDGGPSSVVKAPGSLVVSAYAPCPQISKVVTPDLKSQTTCAKGRLLLIKPAFDEYRLGGSCLSQVYKQTGSTSPDLSNPEVKMFAESFNAIQKLISENKVLAIHDISDGGLITTLVEMAISGWCGIDVNLPPVQVERVVEENVPPEFYIFFNEETGWVLEINEDDLDYVLDTFDSHELRSVTASIGHTTTIGATAKIKCSYNSSLVIDLTILEAMLLWEETSFQLEKLQMNSTFATLEYESWKSRKGRDYRIHFNWRRSLNALPDAIGPSPYVPRVAILREEGSNGDREMAAAFMNAGFIVHDVTMHDLIAGSLSLQKFRGVVFPGGFSYADVLGSAVGWAASIKENDGLYKCLCHWYEKQDTFSLGVCNGCQLMALLGWVGPGGQFSEPSVKLLPNDSWRFESRWSRVKIMNSKSLLLKEMEAAELGIWIAHGEGKFVFRSEDVWDYLRHKNCVALTYIDEDGECTERYPFNPNGSRGGVAALTSECGRHLAMMPHPERCFLSWQWPWPYSRTSVDCSPWTKMFQNAFDWCLSNA